MMLATTAPEPIIPQLQMLDNIVALATPSCASSAASTTATRTTTTAATENDAAPRSDTNNDVCSQQQQQDHHKTYTLYLVRHGEASHNVEEKIAKNKALDEAIANGYTKDCQYTKDQMEQARKDVLNDTKLFDAPLSDLGKEEAKKSSNFLYNDLLKNHPHLPTPRTVIVSPLQRTLQTANIMFSSPSPPSSKTNDTGNCDCDKNSNNDPTTCRTTIHVREELRERCTGKPPDTRMSSEKIVRNPLYRNFSMSKLRRYSLDNKNHTHHPYQQKQQQQQQQLEHESKRQKPNNDEDNGNVAKQEENKSMLRERTNMLWSVLADIKPITTSTDDNDNDDNDSTATSNNAVAIVSHKAYLREIERGPFQRPDSKEFSNGEIRVYRVKINTQDLTLVDSARIV